MKASLVVTIGSSHAETFSLEEFGDFTIGRDPANILVVPDWIASRQHCVVQQRSDGFWIRDLNSHNGTFVNEDKVTEKLLSNGDTIRVGSLSLTFVDEQIDQMTAGDVAYPDLLNTQSDVRRYPLEHQKFSTDLEILVKLGKALSELTGVEVLKQRLLEIILEIIPATRSAIVISDSDEGSDYSFRVSCADDLEINGLQPMQLSQTVTQVVLRENVALLSNTLADESLKASESLMSMRVCSVLCVPLSIGSRRGLIYLDSTNPEFSFNEDHVLQLTAIAGFVSAALAKANQLGALRQENDRLQSEILFKTNMIGESKEIHSVFRLLAKLAPH